MITFENVTKSYGNGAPALSNLNIEIEDGEFVFVVGTSGSGKSTFIKLLLKELEPTEGKIIVNDTELRKLRSGKTAKYRRKVGVVFQDFRLSKDEEMDLFMSRTSATPVRLRLRIKASFIHPVGGESDCRCLGRTLEERRSKAPL